MAFIRSFLAYLPALNFVFKHGLSRYFLYSGLISLALGAVTLGSAYWLADDVGGLVTSLYPYERGAGIIAKVSTVASGLTLGVVGLLLYKYILLILISPFMSPLAERVEEIETGVRPAAQGLGQIGYGMVRGVRISLRNITKELLYTVVLLLLGLIPLFSIPATVLILAVQAYFMGFANTDYHLEKSHTVPQAIQYGKANRLSLTGNGAAFLLLLFVPVIGLLVAPVLGTVAATRQSLKHGRVIA